MEHYLEDDATLQRRDDGCKEWVAPIKLIIQIVLDSTLFKVVWIEAHTHARYALHKNEQSAVHRYMYKVSNIDLTKETT